MTDLLDLRGIGQRQSTFRFDVIDCKCDGRVVGTIHPKLTVSISHDATRQISRELSNVWLIPDEAASFDVFRNWVLPYMVLEDGSEYPLGVFVPIDDNRPRYSWGQPLAMSMADLSVTLDHGTSSAISIAAGQDLENILAQLLTDNGTKFLIDTIGAVAGAGGLNWDVGTSLLQIVNDIATAGGWMAPYFDHLGFMRIRQQVTSATPIDITYEDGLNIFSDSIVESNNTLDAPNRFIVVDTSSLDTPIVGVYDVDPGLPYSAYNRGFVATELIQHQGLTSVKQAEQIAATAAQEWDIVTTVEFQGPPDPRHDGWSVINFRSISYIESTWDLELRDGAPMSHTIRRFT